MTSTMLSAPVAAVESGELRRLKQILTDSEQRAYANLRKLTLGEIQLMKEAFMGDLEDTKKSVTDLLSMQAQTYLQ